MWTNSHHSYQYSSFNSTAFTHGLASVAGLQPCVAYSRHLGAHGGNSFGYNPIQSTLNYTPMTLNHVPLPFVNQIPQPAANPFAMNIMQQVPIMTPFNPTQVLFNQLPLPVIPMPMRRPRADTSIASMVTRFRNRMSFNRRRNNSPIETRFDPPDMHAAPDHITTDRRPRADNSDRVPPSRHRPSFTRRHNHSPSGIRIDLPDTAPDHSTTNRRPRADNSDRADIPSSTHHPTVANRRTTNSRSRASNFYNGPLRVLPPIRHSNNNNNNNDNNGRRNLPTIEETVDDPDLPNIDNARLQRSRVSNSDNRIPTATIAVRSRNRSTSIRNDPERSNQTSSVREDSPPDQSTTTTIASTQSNNAANVAASEASVREASRRSRHSTSSRNSGSSRSSRQSRECVVCKDDEKRRDCYLRDCGHFVTCMDCAVRLQHCPVCRKPIKERLRVYT